MSKNQIALIQVWIGKLPDYFEYHLATCEMQRVDFYFFTDQEVDEKFQRPNIKFIKMTLAEVQARLEEKVGQPITISNSYKLCDVRPAYADIFEDYVRDYEFVGWYDLDTLFGDIRDWVGQYLPSNDLISFGEEGPIYDRASGPFCIVRNKESLKNAYKEDPEFFETMKSESYGEYDERKFTFRLRVLAVPMVIMRNASNMRPVTWKTDFDATWTGGKLYVGGEEKMIYHFWRKAQTKFERKGNSIVTYRKADYENDFMWVTYFTKNYESIALTFIKSIQKFSRRKCLLYTVNYSSDLAHVLSDQFIVRRIDLDKNNDLTDDRGRSFNALTCKPLVTMDSIRAYPNMKFAFADTDIFVTVSADEISKYFDRLEHYPLANMHVHDTIYVHDNGELVSSLHELGDEVGVPITVYPRRKCNVILYSAKSYWFFNEQMNLWYKHRHSKRRCIFGLHDEDTFNLILSKYKLTKSLPVIDMEEGYTIDIGRFYNYSYNYTPISELAIVPKSERDIHVFHGYKTAHDWEKINELYSQTVIDNTDLFVHYDGKDLIFEKNSYLFDKKFDQKVTINVYDAGTLYFSSEWDILSSQFFYVWDLAMAKGKTYFIELLESTTGRLLYRHELTIK